MKILPEVTGELMASEHSCGRTWPLPRDATCARVARSRLSTALDDLGVPADAVYDAALMISELATNAYRHATCVGGPELWLVPAGRTQVACAVFDGLQSAAGPDECLDDHGRGLDIVDELARGRWGSRRTVSRLGPHHGPGKIVWFLCPVAPEVVEALACCGPDPLRLQAPVRHPRSAGRCH